MKNFLFPCSLLLVLVPALQSCHVKKDHSAEIRTLDSLSSLVETKSKALQMVLSEPPLIIADSIDAHLKYVQDNFVGSMYTQMATELSHYNSLRKNMVYLDAAVIQQQAMAETSKKQLSGLRQALSENATHDAVHNPMTDQYVQKSVADEVNRASAIIGEIDGLTSELKLIKADYSKTYGTVKLWVDSIPEITKK